MERDRSPAMTMTLELPGTTRSPDGLADVGCSSAWESWAVAPCGGEAAGVSEETVRPAELVSRPSRDGRERDPVGEPEETGGGAPVETTSPLPARRRPGRAVGRVGSTVRAGEGAAGPHEAQATPRRRSVGRFTRPAGSHALDRPAAPRGRMCAVRILLWHGYLLGGTGSNVYTRQLAREWGLAGHEVTVLSQDPRPEDFDLGGAAAVRPVVGGFLPVFVLDRYEGYEVRRVPDCTRGELERWVEANAAAVRELLPAHLVFANHVLLGGPVGLASGAPYAVKAHGSELEYAMRGRPDLGAWGAEALAPARATFVGSAHIRTVCRGLRRGAARPRGAPRCRRRPVGARGARRRAGGARRRGAARLAEPRQPGGATPGRRQRRPARRLSRRGRADGRVLREADRAEGRPRAARGAPRRRGAPRGGGLRPRAARTGIVGGLGGGGGAFHGPARAPSPSSSPRARGCLRRAVRVPGGVRDGGCGGRRHRVPAGRRPSLGARGGRRRARGGSRRRSPGSSASRRAMHPRSASGSRPCSRSLPRIGRC